MSQLQNVGILIGAIGGTVGGIGGVLSIVKWVQEQGDRSRKNRALRLHRVREAAYQRLIEQYEDSLSSGDGRAVLEVPPHHRRHVLRAVREGRLAWTEFANLVCLPARAFDA